MQTLIYISIGIVIGYIGYRVIWGEGKIKVVPQNVVKEVIEKRS